MEYPVLNRRGLLKAGGLLLASGLTIGARAITTRSAAAPPSQFEGRPSQPLPPRPRLGSDQVVFVELQSATAEQYSTAFNSRTVLTPKLRALCKTPAAVAVLLEWAREHAIPFALRSGGHSFEGLSQSTELVIDTRLLNQVVFDRSEQVVHVGAGALLSDIYGVLGREDHAIPAGYCQSVGIAGLTLGGGIGYLSRSAGLTCDALQSLEIVDAEGRQLTVNAQSHSDLFWACRGGGGGSFGVATNFRFSTLAVPSVIVFQIDWVLRPDEAADLMTGWQSWGSSAPEEIATVLYLSNYGDGKVLIHLVGQSIGTEEQLRHEITQLTGHATPWSPPSVRHQSFLQAANHFSAPDHTPTGSYKFKSDIVSTPLSPQAFRELFEELRLSPLGVFVTCEALGGAAARIPQEATAFPHREGVLFNMQYSAKFLNQSQMSAALQTLSRIYGGMRPHMSGAAYVNYCDTELDDWPRAYWRSNLDRLEEIKRKYDPDNVFQHAQSVPLR